MKPPAFHCEMACVHNHIVNPLNSTPYAQPKMVRLLLYSPLEEQMNNKRILVAASLTRGRDAAFNRGLALARASGAELYVLHAVSANRSFSAHAAERLEIRKELQQRAQRAGVAFEAVEQHGDPAEIIELHANARGAELIVMGAGPARRVRWFQRPSVAERVLRRTVTPTLIVPADDDGESRYSNVLVAVDLSPASKMLVQQAVQWSAGNAPRVTLVHAVRGIESAAAVQSPARWSVPEYRTYVFNDARRRLAKILTDVPGVVDPGLQLAANPTPQAIVEHGNAIDADLIVLGSTRRFKPLGSTAARVLADNTRALLVIPVNDVPAGMTDQEELAA